MIDLISTAILCALGLWCLLALLLHTLYPRVRNTIARLAPEQAGQLTLAWLATPMVASLGITALLYWPDLAQWLVASHCHRDLCQQHGPVTPLAKLPAALLLSWFSIRLLLAYWRLWRPASKLRRQLQQQGVEQQAFVLLPDSAPSAFTLGFFNPVIFISSGLMRSCSEADIRCIIDHEQAHRRRNDNLRKLLAKLFCAPLPSRWLQAAVSDHSLYCEQSCDQAAGRARPRDEVAATLLGVARLQHQPVPAQASAFSATHTEERIRALLAPERPQLGRAAMAALMASAFLLLTLLVDPLHWLLEQLH